MVDIKALKDKYFTTLPPSWSGCHITPLIDCEEFNKELEKALDIVGGNPDPSKNSADGHFILIANWWLGLMGGEWIPPPQSGAGDPLWKASEDHPPYFLKPGGTEMITILKRKAKLGVDIRVMGWTSFAVMDSRNAQLRAANYAEINTLTIASILELRKELDGKAILNIICHTAGSAHAKVIVIGTNVEAIGFTGGIDLVSDRWAHSNHPASEIWHDVMAKVEGPAVQALYNWFRDFWTNNLEEDGKPRLARQFRVEGKMVPHILPTTPALPARDYYGLSKGMHHVQSLRTLPARNYKKLSIAPEPPRSLFPETGVFELQEAWIKALSAAETYVYMEDQSYWSQKILCCINARIKANPKLKVILVTGGERDPNDPDLDDHPIMCQSINHGLLKDLTPNQIKNQVRMYRLWGEAEELLTCRIITITITGSQVSVEIDTDTDFPEAQKDSLANRYIFLRSGLTDTEVIGNEAVLSVGRKVILKVNNPAPNVIELGPASLLKTRGIFVHSKTTLVDDHWAIIGSANCMRRSLYTDNEHAVAFLDEDDKVVKDYRKRLWANHFQHPNPSDFDNIDEAMHGWESSWGTPGAAPSRPKRIIEPGPDYIEPILLPLTPDIELKGKRKDRYDILEDIDSRKDWGFIITPK